MKTFTNLIVLLLFHFCLYAQKEDKIIVFVSDYTQDGRINEKDSIIVYIPDIYHTIEKEEWDRSGIDLSINDISLEEIVPNRISRTLTFQEDGQEKTISTDLLAFIIQKNVLDRDRLDALRRLENMASAYVSVHLPNDAVLSGPTRIEGLTRTSYRSIVSWLSVGVIAIFLMYIGVRTPALRDLSSLAKDKKPYSFSRCQVFWWTLIILSSLTYILISTSTFSVNSTVWILLGISGATLGVGAAIDNKDVNKVGRGKTHQNLPSEGWLFDILMDNQGVSIHRVQAFLFNIGFGVFYLVEVLTTLEIPEFDTNMLALLGLSNGAYALVKNNENNQPINSNSDEQE
ncbi:MAG: hypothetical protein MI975_19685 [Cytophagales bacterium]|nr:hypothetical protein [Cytophagales bacterium]